MKSPSIFLACLWIVLTIPAMAARSQPVTSPDKVPDGLEKSDWHSIRAAHEGWKHRFHAVEGGWLADNPGQQWATSFDGRGFLAKPQHADWKWGLQFQNYGFGENLIEVLGKPEVRAGDQRLTYQWDDNVEEWFLNDSRGLEHGFIVKNRPAGGKKGEPLIFTLDTLGSLRANVSSDMLTVHFRDAAGAPVLNYSGLKVWDADGTILNSSFEQGREGQFRIAVAETGAKYPLTIDPIAQQAYLKASNNPLGGGEFDYFGCSVAVSGETVIIGARGEDSSTSGVNSTPNENLGDSGAAYVFVRNGTTWSQQAYLKASNPGVSDYFGASVALSGDTVVVGAYRENSSGTGVDSTPNEISTDSGAAYVFLRSGTTWSQQAFLKPSNTGADDHFGESVSISGETIVVGASLEDSNTAGLNDGVSNAGSAYVFERSGTTWSQQALLKASNAGAGDQFGSSVAISGDTIVVGAFSENSSTTGVNSIPDNTASGAGAAYVFERSNRTWSQQAYLKASNTSVGDWYGCSVAVSGDTVVVGVSREDSSTIGVNSIPDENAMNSGAAYVYERSGQMWSQQAYLKSSNAGSNDQFGISVALSGDTILVGANEEDTSFSLMNDGAAYVFERSGTTWSEQAYLKASNNDFDDKFGSAVAVSGDIAVIGAYLEDSSTTGVNSSPKNNASESGAAYVFVRTGTTWSQQAYLKAGNNGVTSNFHFGWSVAVSGNTVVVGAPSENSSTTGVNSTPKINAMDSGAAYVFVRNGTMWSQQAYLKASNTSSGDEFGYSVAVSGDIVVVGAYLEDSSKTGVNSTPDDVSLNFNSGAAYVFVRSGTTWSQHAYLKASNTDMADLFGSSVAVSGNTLVVGASRESNNSGAAYVFVRSGTTWSQQAYLKAINTLGEIQFGGSVAISENTIVVGASMEGRLALLNSGAAFVFVRTGTAWGQQAYLKASNAAPGDQFGTSVALGGDTVVVGAPFEDSSTAGINITPDENATSSGAAYVFVRSGSIWNQKAYLKASNPGAEDQFGKSVALSGDIVVVGAYLEDSNSTGMNSTPNESASSSGAAYVYLRSGETWNQQAYLKASNTSPIDGFGCAVAVSGDTVIVGAYNETSSTTGVNSTPNDNSGYNGAAYIFTGLGPVIGYPDMAIEQAISDIFTGTTYSFGSIAADLTTERAFTIINKGTVPLTLIGSPMVTLSGSPDFTVTSQPSSMSIAPGATGNFTVRFSPTGSGLKSATLSIVNNDADASPFVIQLTGTAGTPAALFATAVSSGTGLTGGNALPNATPFNDGVANLLKYAFNMSLSGPDTRILTPDTGTSGLPLITTPDAAPPGTLRFEFLRQKDSGLIYTPQKSTTLIASSWSPLTSAPVVTSISSQWERVVYTEAPGPTPAPACFGRVQVVLP